jgi:hypothetical protein
MKTVIQVSASDDAKAWGILQRHSPGVALPNRTFVITDAAARALAKAGIRFKELSREPDALASEGLVVGERI